MIMEKVFGDKGGVRNTDPSIIGNLHQILARLNREPFVSNAAASTVKIVQERTNNLISFSTSWVDQSIWERVSNIQVDPSGTIAEADFFPLIRYFVGDLASGILMGHEFMNNNPDLLPDLFTFDSSFGKLLAGFPWWFPNMGASYQARRRLVRAVREHQEAHFAVWEDRDPGSKWGDLSDVSNVMRDRARGWRDARVGPDTYAPADFAIMWAANVNANQIIFWVLWYVYQRPDLRAEIMKEIAPFAKLTAVHSDLPIKEPPRLTIDLEGLLRECPLFKATYFETMRMEAPSTTYKSVTETFHITESAEDAALAGKSQPQTYRFAKGTYICIPHGVHSMDGRYWKDPKTFNPRRFFVVDDNEKDPGQKPTVDMGTMKVFGGGSSMCKGRNFAEREVLILCAAILTVWDVEPVEGKWRDLGRVIGSGSLVPKRDVRVRLRRRVVE
jgi:cytochrome P450